MKRLLLILLVVLFVSDSYAGNAKHQRPSAVEPTSNYRVKIAYDVFDNTEYIGKADPNTSTSDSAWQIKKFTYATSPSLTSRFLISIDWEGGDDIFDAIWDDRNFLSFP